MEARIIGPEEELGDVRGGLHVQGHHLTRDWSKVDPTAEQLQKLQGNRFVELRGSPKAGVAAAASTPATNGQSGAPQSTAAEAESIRARLTELGVAFKPKTPLMALRSALAKAEKAKAEADAEDDD